ncbi:MAG: TIGR02652 family protein [Synechococcaceae cyanobacterium RL_1_2]|nr:TIGR02652 family protein [Synechococcaceae cyanobacterium RL_1_2]
MTTFNSQYPIFGPEIICPHCHQPISALTLTDIYLCHRHGPFEADPATKILTHTNSGRQWKQWQRQWYRQHIHHDGLRFEIHEALDQLYAEGWRATQITIAPRYRAMLEQYLITEQGLQLYGIPTTFALPHPNQQEWEVINFNLEKEAGLPKDYPYYRIFE